MYPALERIAHAVGRRDDVRMSRRRRSFRSSISLLPELRTAFVRLIVLIMRHVNVDFVRV